VTRRAKHWDFQQGIASLRRIVGPLIAGSIYSLIGPGAPFNLGSVLSFLALLIAFPVMPVALKRCEIAVTASDEVTINEAMTAKERIEQLEAENEG
jgi:MFS family permease